MSTAELTRSSKWREGYTRLAEFTSSLLPNSSQSTIVELGCGRGQLTIPLARFYNGEIVCVDMSKICMETLQKTVDASGIDDRIDLITSGAEDIQLNGAKFDAVLSNFFVGWLSQDAAQRVMEKTFDLLREGGITIHSDFIPEAHSPAQAIAIEQGKSVNNFSPSAKWWNPNEFSDVLRESGLKEIKIESFDWNLKFKYEDAVEQLKSWGARPVFISSKKRELRDYGLEIPKSFVLSARK
jgi:cyclopropane fatty-acyl-phospholipid synthase-like methyltransferase